MKKEVLFFSSEKAWKRKRIFFHSVERDEEESFLREGPKGWDSLSQCVNLSIENGAPNSLWLLKLQVH